MAATLEAALMVSFSQIVAGEASCVECDEPANVTLSADPDYHDAPMCWRHARGFIDLARHLGERFWE